MNTRVTCLGITLVVGLVLTPKHNQEAPPVHLKPATGRGSAELSGIYSLRELADGRILIAAEGGRQLVAIDLSNDAVLPVSRRGSGPGEYERLGELLPIGRDSTAMLDAPRNRRLILHGTRAIESPIALRALEALRQNLPPILGTDGKRILVRSFPPQGPPVTHTIAAADSSLLLAISIATGAVDTIVRLRQQPGRRIITPGRKPGTVAANQTVNLAWVLGETASMCRDSWIAVVRMEPYRVDWLSPDGRWTFGQPIPYSRSAVTEREKRAWAARYELRIPGLNLPTLPPDWPNEIPPQGTMVPSCAPDGRLFILRNYTADRQFPLYDVVSRSGSVVRLALAKDQRLIGFGAQSIYVATRDALDVERIERHAYPF